MKYEKSYSSHELHVRPYFFFGTSSEPNVYETVIVWSESLRKMFVYVTIDDFFYRACIIISIMSIKHRVLFIINSMNTGDVLKNTYTRFTVDYKRTIMNKMFFTIM